MVAPTPHSALLWLQVHYQAVLPLQRHLAELQREHAAMKRAAEEARAAAEMAATKQATGDQQLDLGEVEATALVLESHECSKQVGLRLHCSFVRLRPLAAASYGDAVGLTQVCLVCLRLLRPLWEPAGQASRECSQYAWAADAALALNRAGLSASTLWPEERMPRGQTIVLPRLRCAERRFTK